MVGGLSWGYVGPSWSYVDLSWGQCGPILGLCWPLLGLCWPLLGLCWPISGLCWPILGLCWPILRPMLAHLEAYVGPCWPILNHKIRKMGKNATSTKHRKTRGFLATRGGRRQGRRPLSPTEREKRLRQGHGQGPLAGFKGCRPAADPGRPKFSGTTRSVKKGWSTKSERVRGFARLCGSEPAKHQLHGCVTFATAKHHLICEGLNVASETRVKWLLVPFENGPKGTEASVFFYACLPQLVASEPAKHKLHGFVTHRQRRNTT